MDEHNMELVKQARELMAYDPPFVLIPVKLTVNDDGKLEKMPVMKWSAAPIPEKDILKKLTGRTVNGLAFDLKRSNLVVIDVDMYKKECNWWEWLEETGNELPGTWKVKTGSGGIHYIFSNPNHIQLRGNIGGVAAVDIKSAGIEIIPPSCVDQHQYDWLTGPDEMEDGPVQIPQWLIDECGKGTDEQDSPQKLLAALGMREPEENVEILDRLMGVPNSGIGYSEWLMVMMGLHFEFHETEFEEHALVMFCAWTRGRAESEDDLDEVANKWDSLPRMTEIQSPYVTIGSVYHFINQFEKPPMPAEKAAELTAAVEQLGMEAVKVDAPSQQQPSRFTPRAIEPRPWVMGTDLIKGEVSTLFAAGGTGKSSLVILQALAIATGRDLLGAKVFGKRTVWLWNGEDGMDELVRRITAAMQHYGITEEELGGRLILQTGDSMPINIAYETTAEERKQGKNVPKISVDGLMIDWICDTAAAMGVEVIMFDPFINTHQLNENDNVHVNVVMQAFKKIARDGDVAVQLVHHIAKGTLRDESKGESADAARGATSFINAARVGMALQQMTKAEATLAEVENETSFVKLIDSKANLAARRSMADVRWFEKVSVKLGNGNEMYPDGDEVAVMVRHTLSEPIRLKRLGQILTVVETLRSELLRNDDDTGAHGEDGEMGFVFKNAGNAFWAGWKIAEVLGLPMGEVGREEGRSDKENENRALVVHLLSEAMAAGYIKNTAMRIKAGDGRLAPVYTVEDDAFAIIHYMMKKP